MSFKPMLAADGDVNRLVTTDERRPGYDRDDAWCYQQKYNGHRVVITVSLGQVTVTGRDGQRSQHTHRFQTPAHVNAFALLEPHLVVLDGEYLPKTGAMWIYDLIAMETEGDGPQVLASDPFSFRLEQLEQLFEEWAPPSNLFCLAPTAVGYEAKLHLALDCVRRHTEGVMARRLDAAYRPGVRSTGLLKLKFIHDADLVVMEIGFEGRDNVVLGAYPPGAAEPIEVGRASAHGKGAPAKGAVLVVRYNYMSADGRLVGPRIIAGPRLDKSARECSTEQLFYSQEVPVHEH